MSFVLEVTLFDYNNVSTILSPIVVAGQEKKSTALHALKLMVLFYFLQDFTSF